MSQNFEAVAFKLSLWILSIGPGKYIIKDDFTKTDYSIKWGNSKRSQYFLGIDPTLMDQPSTGGQIYFIS